MSQPRQTRPRPLMTEMLAAMRDHRPIRLELSATSAMVLISQLQLALRHPANRGVSTEVARAIKDELIEGLEIPERVRTLIRLGDDPRFDQPSRSGEVHG